MTTLANDGSQKLSFWEKAGFGTGDMASCLIWNTLSMYLMFYYTDIFGLSAEAAGFMIMILRALDAFVDPAVGIMADRTNTRFGKFRPYLIWFSVPFAIAVVFTFTTPVSFSSSAKLIYAYLTYGTMMILYSIVNIPYSAMLGVITSDPVERTSLSSFKYVGAYLGGLIVSATLLPLAKYFGGGSEAHGWSVVMTIYSVAAVLLFGVTFISTKERITPPPAQKTSLVKDLKDLFGNGPWVILFVVSLLMILFSAISGTVTTYYFKYFVGTQMVMGKKAGFEEITSVFYSTSLIATIISVIVVPYVVKKIGKKNTMIAYFTLASVVSLPIYFLAPNQLFWLMAINLISAFFMGPLSPIIWAMYADTADFSEWKNNRRATALVFSVAILVQKLGWAVASAITGWLLTKFGFDANHAQNPDVIHLLIQMKSFIPFVIGIVGVMVVLFYSLTEKRMQVIGGELATRR